MSIISKAIIVLLLFFPFFVFSAQNSIDFKLSARSCLESGLSTPSYFCESIQESIRILDKAFDKEKFRTYLRIRDIIINSELLFIKNSPECIKRRAAFVIADESSFIYEYPFLNSLTEDIRAYVLGIKKYEIFVCPILIDRSREKKNKKDRDKFSQYMARLLIHEAAHHLGIFNECLAESVALMSFFDSKTTQPAPAAYILECGFGSSVLDSFESSSYYLSQSDLD